MNRFVVGVGASGEFADDLVVRGIEAMAAKPLLHIVSRSPRCPNPAWGGATRAPFVNAAVVVDTALGAPPFLQLLFTIERAFGRLRNQKNGARTLDLDVLWSVWSIGASSHRAPTLPHPRLRERGFAVVPAVLALQAAGEPVPLPLLRAAMAHRLRLGV
jgi:2-amino-4-hydroxy-6-hydroxymethyldihydropteridine diphosphokinase